MKTKPRPKPLSSAFTLIEMLVVLAILIILLMLITGGVSRALQRARAVTCMSNLRQIGLLFPQYALENNGYVPWTRPAEMAEGSQGYNWNSFGPADSAIGTREGWNGRFPGGELPYLLGYREGGDMSRDEYRRPGASHIFNCPVGNNRAVDGDLGYSMNRHVGGIAGRDSRRNRMSDIPNPAEVFLVADNSRGADDAPYADRQTPPWFTRSESGYAAWTNTLGFERHSGRAHVLFADLHVNAVSREQASVDNIRLPSY